MSAAPAVDVEVVWLPPPLLLLECMGTVFAQVGDLISATTRASAAARKAAQQSFPQQPHFNTHMENRAFSHISPPAQSFVTNRDLRPEDVRWHIQVLFFTIIVCSHTLQNINLSFRCVRHQ